MHMTDKIKIWVSVFDLRSLIPLDSTHIAEQFQIDN